MSRGWYRIWLVVFWIFIFINLTFFYWYLERIIEGNEYSHIAFNDFYISIFYTVAYLALIYLVSFIIRGFKISKK